MSVEPPYQRFSALDFDSFREMALDPTLSSNERSGFPDEIRSGAEQEILTDIVAKLPMLAAVGATVVDIGCGANALTYALIDHCKQHQHLLILVDSAEVLSHLQSQPGTSDGSLLLIPGEFPKNSALLSRYVSSCDAVVAYSVLQYVFADSNVHGFLDASLSLLAPGGRLLLGDVPNASMRRRFLASDAGREFHRVYTGRDDDPTLSWGALPVGEIDDGVIYGLVARTREAGFHAWLVPQAEHLPMANRREDLICHRP